jgi:C4-dicarboxylate-specific signal transduction histidine kinase
MEDKNKGDLRFLQLNFIGRILASFTHEVKNYVAIIKESAGLMGDMIKAGKTGKGESRQYLEIIASIEDQIERTLDIFRYLNRFAHKMDSPLVSFNVNESMEDLLGLMNRFANQRKISFERDFQKDLPQIQNDPAMLQFLVFCFIQEKLDSLDKNSKIILKTSLSDGAVTITIVAHGTCIETATKGLCSPEVSDYVISLLGGKILHKKEDQGTQITLPFSMPGACQGVGG